MAVPSVLKAADPDASLTELSLEELIQTDVRIVSSASRYEQDISKAPASVTVVTAEEIRRYGYRNIDDVLRSVLGFNLNNDRNYSYTGVRGVSLPADFNSRVLLLLDGHRLNEPIYGLALLGWESGIDLGTVERVEVVRGPASALYGANALFGVVNIITKRPAHDPGERVELLAESPALLRGSFGTRHPAAERGWVGWSGAVHILHDGGDDELYFPEFDGYAESPSSTPPYDGVAHDRDGERAKGLWARVEMGKVILSAFASRRDKDVPTGNYQTLFDAGRLTTRDDRSFLEALWQGKTEGAFTWDLRGSVDQYVFQGQYPYAYNFDYSGPGFDQPPFTIERDDHEAIWAGLDWQGRYTGLAGHSLVMGGNWKGTWADLNTFDEDPSYTYMDDSFSFGQCEAFLQDEIELGPAFRLVAGLSHNRYDPDTFKGKVDRTNPRLGLLWSVGEKTTLKVLYGQAFRVPTLFEMSYEDGGVSQIPNPSLEPEIMQTAELILERDFTPTLRGRVSVYSNRLEELIQAIEYDPVGDPGIIQFQNLESDIQARGAEVELVKAVGKGITGSLGLALQETEDEARGGGEELSNSPREMVNGALSIPLRRGRTFLSFDAHYVGEVLSRDGSETIDPFLLANASLLSRSLLPKLDLNLTVRNLFDTDIFHPTSFDFLQNKLLQNGRKFGLQAAWRF